MKIIVEKLSENEIQNRGIRNWPIWEKEVSRFDSIMIRLKNVCFWRAKWKY